MHNNTSIFIIEDSQVMRDMMSEVFLKENYLVESAGTISEFHQKFQFEKPDMILLDLILPDGSGLGLIQEIRKHTDVPIIVISGKTDLVDKIVGFEMGADDYIVKPFKIKEIVARVRAHIRRYRSMKNSPPILSDATSMKESSVIQFGSWILDRNKLQAFDEQGLSANLTIGEYRLLEVLVFGEGSVFSRQKLLNIINDGVHNTTDRAIDVHILRIRKKLDKGSNGESIIRTVHGVGYMLVSDVSTTHTSRAIAGN